MKIARIVLTATILFSLKSTLFCSSSAAIEPEIVTAPVLVRRKSHDGTRDGHFGSAADTFSKLGQTYKGAFGLGEEQIYDLGSDEQAPARWASFGKTIKTLSDAQKWVQAVAKKGWSLPAESMQPSLDIIAADKAIKIQENFTTFNHMQEVSRSLIAQIVKTNADRTALDHERNQFYKEEIIKITQTKALEFTNREIERNAQDTKISSDLKDILEKTKTFRLDHNTQFPENPIHATPVVKREDINKLNAKTLAHIALKYNAALKDAAK